MKILNKTSLVATVGAVNDALLAGQRIQAADRKAVVDWLVSRQGESGGYQRVLPAPTGKDFAGDRKLFTGEPIGSQVGVSHILGQEAYRVLLVLGGSNAAMRKTLKNVTTGMDECLRGVPKSKWWKVCPGEYCCGKCSLSLWRAMAAGGYRELTPSHWLKSGMRSMKACRRGDGQWRRFPFYYGVLALSEIDIPSARKELQYAAPRLERALKRSIRKDKYSARRRIIAERALAAL